MFTAPLGKGYSLPDKSGAHFAVELRARLRFAGGRYILRAHDAGILRFVLDVNDWCCTMQDDKSGVSGILARLAEAESVRNDNELAKKLGVKRGTVSSWRSRNTIPFQECRDAAERSGLSLEWILNGRGPKYRKYLEEDFREVTTLEKFIAEEYELIRVSGVVFDQSGDIILDRKFWMPLAFRRSYLKSISTEHVEFFGYTCGDDSMEPTIKSGDFVIVERPESPHPTIAIDRPGIFGFIWKGRTIFRRINPIADKLILSADNEKYPTQEISLIGRPRFAVVGRALWAGGPRD